MPRADFEIAEDALVNVHERDEALGQAIIEASLMALVHSAYPRLTPAGLASLRAKLASNDHLALVSDKFALADKLEAARQMNAAGTKTSGSSIFKHYIASAYLAHGFDAIHKWMKEAFAADLAASYASLKAHPSHASSAEDAGPSAISMLEEWKARAPRGRIVVYEERLVGGEAHAPTFEVVCKVNGELCGTGQAGKKKTAKQLAARQAAVKLGLIDADAVMTDVKVEVKEETL